jgi:phosphatidylinositol alpha-mannosyltransferase
MCDVGVVHVALISPYSMARPGGVQEHTRGLARALVALGHEVSLFGPELRSQQDRLDDVATMSLGPAIDVPANGSVARLGIDPRMLVRFDLALDAADVVHVHEPFLPASIAALLRRPRRTAVVGTFHAAAERFWPYAMAAPLLRRLAKRLDQTTAVSPEARRLVRRYVNVDPDIVPNGVDVEAYEKAEADEWAMRLGKVVLVVGRVDRRKGFDVVCRAFARIAPDVPDAHLVITATPEELPEASLSDRIHCVGVVDEERKRALHRAADVVCCASTSGESFGMVVLEGLAGASAVLASDIAGYRYAGGDSVTYVAPGDVDAWANALGALLRSDGDRERFADRGPDRARLFDWSRIAEQTLHSYERALTAQAARDIA